MVLAGEYRVWSALSNAGHCCPSLTQERAGFLGLHSGALERAAGGFNAAGHPGEDGDICAQTLALLPSCLQKASKGFSLDPFVVRNGNSSD